MPPITLQQAAQGFREAASDLDDYGADGVSVRSLVQRGFDVQSNMILAPTSDGKGYPVARETALTDPHAKATRMRLTPRYEKAWFRFFEQALRHGADLAPRQLTVGEHNALTEGSASGGGWLVPAAFEAEILSRVAATAVVRPKARVFPTDSDRLVLPAFAPHATDPTTYVAPWVPQGYGESGPGPAQADPVIEAFEISVKKLRTPELAISNDLIADAPFALQFIIEAGSMNLAAAEDSQFIAGDATAFQMRGALNSGLAEAAAGAPTAAGLKGVVEALAGQYRPRARWIMNTTVEADARDIVASSSNVPIYARDANNGRIENFPVDVSPFIPSTRVLLMDWSRYLIAQRSLEVVVDRVNGLDRDQTRVYIFERLGGGVWDTAAGKIGTVA